MAPLIIDLTADDDSDVESPARAAASALQHFQPRAHSNKSNVQKASGAARTTAVKPLARPLASRPNAPETVAAVRQNGLPQKEVVRAAIGNKQTAAIPTPVARPPIATPRSHSIAPAPVISNDVSPSLQVKRPKLVDGTWSAQGSKASVPLSNGNGTRHGQSRNISGIYAHVSPHDARSELQRARAARDHQRSSGSLRDVGRVDYEVPQTYSETPRRPRSTITSSNEISNPIRLASSPARRRESDILASSPTSARITSSGNSLLRSSARPASTSSIETPATSPPAQTRTDRVATSPKSTGNPPVKIDFHGPPPKRRRLDNGGSPDCREESKVAHAEQRKQQEHNSAWRGEGLKTTSEEKLKSGTPVNATSVKKSPLGNTLQSKHGTPYTEEEDQLLIELKEVRLLTWDKIPEYFTGRTSGSLQVRYSTKLKNRTRDVAPARNKAIVVETADNEPRRRPKRQSMAPPANGMVAWSDIVKQNLASEASPGTESPDEPDRPAALADKQYNGARPFPNSISRILRQRELGCSGRGSMPSVRGITKELKEHVFDDLGPRTYFKGTSSDVTCIAWAPNGNNFAAGSIAITDDRSMQYNKPNNLLLGDYARSSLLELPEHHVRRPIVQDHRNPNGSHSMREPQDPRLFTTVASVQFSPDSRTLFSAGGDRKVRAYSYDKNLEEASCLYELDHDAPLDLMCVSNGDLVATACHQPENSIAIFDGQMRKASWSPSRIDLQIERAIYPSALRWGVPPHLSNYLLAGFSIDSFDDERDLAGETCLWDVVHERRLAVGAMTRNVFDVAWNPSASAASHIFAVACTPGQSKGLTKVGKRTRSVVQCFAPGQDRARRVLELECPAFDINDVVYCPYDSNLLAVGATDGNVYVWDVRRGEHVLHTLSHSESLSVLDHDRDREMADTGVRFLSWGATSSRLYSGSSDGVVKVWDPYASFENTHVKDVARFTSAIMSGAFSPDYRELLIGEDQGRINALSVGYAEKSVRSMDTFAFKPAPLPPEMATSASGQQGREYTRELVESGQIEIKSAGTLPIRQAVRGPNYKGPFLAPSPDQIRNAEVALKEACEKQSQTAVNSQMLSSPTSETSDALTKADQAVREAEDMLKALKLKAEDAEILGLKAAAFQKSLLVKRKERKRLIKQLPRTKRCSLDCTYLPTLADDDDVGVPDSRRSGHRIPTALWPSHDLVLDLDSATPAVFVEAGLTARCMTCDGPAAKPKPDKPATCTKCSLKQKGLTSSCDICASPIPPPATETSTLKTCERCGFGCFRCGKPAFIASDASWVSCDDCELTWRAGVLGYELLESSKDHKGSRQSVLPAQDLPEEGDDFVGREEIERYASRWQT